MRKLFALSLFIFTLSLSFNTLFAEDYTTYQEIEFEHKGAKLLEKFADSDYEKYYDKLGKKRFWGWRTYKAYEDEECTFISETLYVISNDGDTAIEETIRFTKERTSKKYYSATGSLELDGKGSTKGFKYGLDQAIGTNQSLTVTDVDEEVYTLKIKVDPGTKLVISIQGEGKVTNGVGKYYRFFKNVKKGGWEMFTITTEYYSIEKTRL